MADQLRIALGGFSLKGGRRSNGVEHSAVLSPCGRYRYHLARRWDTGPAVLWIMLNPSTADASADDATIRKCVGFAKRWGAGAIEVVNLFALRSTDPDGLLGADDPVGPANDLHIAAALRGGPHLHRVAAWGACRHASERARYVALALLGDSAIQCLGTNLDGSPVHPLMQPYRRELVRWQP